MNTAMAMTIDRDKELPAVSIVTVTQGTRVPFLRIQAENVGRQTYENIKEWVIVDGSATPEESAALRLELSNLRFPRPVTIVYNPWDESKPKIGALRNIANRLASGDIIVNFDDDDYYYTGFVQYAVNTLRTSPKKAQVAGCGPVYIYDLRWQTVFQAKKFNDDHTCNNMIAFTKEYAASNFYDETVSFAEENSFLRWLPNQMAGTLVEQMDPSRCGVHLCHSKNTYNKQSIVLGALCDLESGAYRDKIKGIRNLMPLEYIQKYEAVRGPRKPCPYDIVIFCGGWSATWNPASPDLYEAEQAVTQLAKGWITMGYSVAVYGEIFPSALTTPASPVSPYYFHALDFDPYQDFNVLVLWRNYGIYPLSNIQAPLSVKKLILDLYDNLAISYQSVQKILTTKDYTTDAKVIFKSEFHREEYEAVCGPISSDLYCIIPSGVLIPDGVTLEPPTSRLPWRFCYTLDYRRGLVEILERVWPHIVAMEPRAELHIFVDGSFEDETYRTVKSLLCQTHGVCDHGKQSAKNIALEKKISTFELAITDARGEVDCVSIKQSVALGCIPLLLNICVYKEREGKHFSPSLSSEELTKQIVECIASPPVLTSTSTSVSSWAEVCETWRSRCFVGI